MNFYQDVITKILKKKLVSLNDSILIVAGGEKDKTVFFNCGFNDVIISNLDFHGGIKNYKPYDWRKEDAENLSFKDNTFDWVFAHAGLHHCASPHQALCEMLRVSRKGVGVFESRDSLLNKFANKFGLAPSYEIEPCVLSGGNYGGVRNSHIPNYVYKWTENEVKKTVMSYAPQHQHRFYFYYGLRIPIERLSMSKNILKKLLAKVGKIILPLFTFLFKKQGNLFSFIIEQNTKLQPWLKIENEKIIFDLNYTKNKFDPEKYSN